MKTFLIGIACLLIASVAYADDQQPVSDLSIVDLQVAVEAECDEQGGDLLADILGFEMTPTAGDQQFLSGGCDPCRDACHAANLACRAACNPSDFWCFVDCSCDMYWCVDACTECGPQDPPPILCQ